MKTQHLIPIMFLAAVCTVRAQTNTALANSNTPALLTTNQAEKLAMKLANEKAIELYGAELTNITDIFRTNLLIRNPEVLLHVDPTTEIDTRFKDGHWVSNPNRRLGDYLYMGRVDIAPDGSTNSVFIVRNYFPMPQVPTNWRSR